MKYKVTIEVESDTEIEEYRVKDALLFQGRTQDKMKKIQSLTVRRLRNNLITALAFGKINVEAI